METGIQRLYVDRLSEMQNAAATKAPKYLEWATTEQLLNTAYNGIGIRDEDQSEETLKLKGMFADEVYRRIGLAQNQLKRVLSTGETQDIVDEVAIAGARSRSFLGIPIPSADAFAFSMSAEDIDKFTPNKLPPALRQGIVNAILRSRGPEAGQPSEEDINTAYRMILKRERERLGRAE
jgi:hypothetical protein